jgi:hypothetical protein
MVSSIFDLFILNVTNNVYCADISASQQTEHENLDGESLLKKRPREALAVVSVETPQFEGRILMRIIAGLVVFNGLFYCHSAKPNRRPY